MPDTPAPDDDDLAAAELALRLPDEATVTALRARTATDPAFAVRVDRWDARLAPLFAEIAPLDPPAGLWDRLRTRLADPVAAMRRRVRRWQWATGAASAVAAGLAILLALPRPVPAPVVIAEPAPAPMLAVAQLSDDRGVPLLAAAVERRTGLVRVRLQDLPQEARVPELWVIPAGGAPRSLGLIARDGSIALPLPADLRGDAAAGRATLAVSMERPDGAPHAAPAGPIVATGALVTL